MRRRPLPPVREENPKTLRTLCDHDWVIYSLVALVASVTYANSLNGEFVHDDIPAIVTNGDVNGRNTVVTVFKNDFWGTPMSDPASHKSYRPLTTLSFRLNYLLCGLSPWWWHACNVALHAACCALVARTGAVVARLHRPFAALAALLFAVHPIHTEAFSENTFKNYYYPENKDESTDEEGTPGFKVKQAMAKKRSANNIDSFFELPKKKTKALKRSSNVSQSSPDGVGYISTGQDDGAYASHLIKIEIYDMQKVKNIPPTEHWKHADVRLKFYASSEDESQLQSTRDVIYNITKQVASKDSCVKYFIDNKKH